ncbi:MAG TPA: tetratricopeptide repeat protein [Verrucomicrobiae bacterium]|jgi:tetratricopeptide (TPR) repeat protein|nr:tetratricopeptide repeat protein [Verrucomicrobiae bacterium]
MARLRSWKLVPLVCLGMYLLIAPLSFSQDTQEQTPSALTAPVQVAPAIPDKDASASDLEAEGDDLRADKRFLDSIDFYNVALAKQPTAMLWNKEGMSYLLMQRPDKASKCFDHAIKLDKKAPEGYNNRGYIEQMKKRYDKAIKYYTKASTLRPTDAVFQYNIGSAYFADHQYAKAAAAYKAAFAIDPNIFVRVSRMGIMAQATSPEDAAAFSFMVAKMYAKAGNVDQSLEYLRKAMENGYKKINEVYTDQEFATLRTDKRFEELMAQRPQSLP